jgi:hypothetical protein
LLQPQLSTLQSIYEGQQSDDQDLYDHNREIAKEKHERRMARLALRDQLSENGFALQKALKDESIKGCFPSPLEMEGMSIDDIIMTETPVEDLRYVGIFRDQVFMPASFFQMWVRPTIRVRKALEQSHDKELPGAWKLQCLPPLSASTNRSWI